jgi:hypothetical protein
MTDLTRLRRVLLELKVPDNFLRQYPELAVKVAAVVEKAGTRGACAESPPSRGA